MHEEQQKTIYPFIIVHHLFVYLLGAPDSRLFEELSNFALHLKCIDSLSWWGQHWSQWSLWMSWKTKHDKCEPAIHNDSDHDRPESRVDFAQEQRHPTISLKVVRYLWFRFKQQRWDRKFRGALYLWKSIFLIISYSLIILCCFKFILSLAYSTDLLVEYRLDRRCSLTIWNRRIPGLAPFVGHQPIIDISRVGRTVHVMMMMMMMVVIVVVVVSVDLLLWWVVVTIGKIIRRAIIFTWVQLRVSLFQG